MSRQPVRDGAPPTASFLPLKPRVLLMLLELSRGQSHGYALKEALLAQSKGRVDLGPGTLYRTLQSLVADGLINESAERPAAEHDDDRRRYYRITPLGREVLVAEARRLDELLTVARAQRLL